MPAHRDVDFTDTPARTISSAWPFCSCLADAREYGAITRRKCCLAPLLNGPWGSGKASLTSGSGAPVGHLYFISEDLTAC